jgi:hypothetical protein
MVDWNGQDPIKAGDRLSIRVGNRLTRKVIVLYVSDAFFVGREEGSSEEIGLPRERVKFEVLVTDRDLAIEDMAEITGKDAKAFKRYFAMIYDAGYRKA